MDSELKAQVNSIQLKLQKIKTMASQIAKSVVSTYSSTELALDREKEISNDLDGLVRKFKHIAIESFQNRKGKQIGKEIENIFQ